MLKSFKLYLEHKDAEPLNISDLKNVDVLDIGPGYIFYRAMNVEQAQEILKIWPDLKLPLQHENLLQQYFNQGYIFFFYITKNKTDFLFFECDGDDVLKVVHDAKYTAIDYESVPQHVQKIVEQYIKVESL